MPRKWLQELKKKIHTYILIQNILSNIDKFRYFNLIFNLLLSVTEKPVKEDCSDHGKYMLGKCRCDRLYYGSRCQFRDECIENKDCGDQGRCVDVQASTPPRKQCYCESGWFGPACTKSNF